MLETRTSANFSTSLTEKGLLQETATVVATEGSAIWVEAIKQSTCGSCVAKKGCGQRLLSTLGVKSDGIRVLLNESQRASVSNISIGDTVNIGIPNHVVVNLSLFIYLLPLLLMIVFSGLAHTYLLNELVTMSMGGCGLLLGGIFIRVHAFYSQNDRRLQPILIDTVVHKKIENVQVIDSTTNIDVKGV